MTCEEYVINRLMTLESEAKTLEDEVKNCGDALKAERAMNEEAWKIVDGLRADIAFLAQFFQLKQTSTATSSDDCYLAFSALWNRYDSCDYQRAIRILGFEEETLK